MKRWIPFILVGALALIGGSMAMDYYSPNLQTAWARGFGRGGGCPMGYSGQPGGRDFQPQQGYYRSAPGQQGQYAQNPAVKLTPERARDLAANQLQPGLSLGRGNDKGNYYEFEVRSQDKVVDRLAVDKSSGLVRPLN